MLLTSSTRFSVDQVAWLRLEIILLHHFYLMLKTSSTQDRRLSRTYSRFQVMEKSGPCLLSLLRTSLILTSHEYKGDPLLLEDLQMMNQVHIRIFLNRLSKEVTLTYRRFLTLTSRTTRLKSHYILWLEHIIRVSNASPLQVWSWCQQLKKKRTTSSKLRMQNKKQKC